MVERTTLIGPEGRVLEIEIAGPENGRTVIQHHGTPSAGRLYPPDVEAGARRGLRHVAYSRPGYGDSDRSAGRSVADCAQDVKAILDALDVRRAFVVGGSGGGPHALACAALLGERVLAAATLGSPAPANAEGLDWTAGMGEENVEEFGAAQAGEEALRDYLESHGAEVAGATGPDLFAALGDLLSGVDRDALTGELADHLATSTATALKHGIWGWFDDDLALLHDWGFEVERIERPVMIWHGRQDRFVPCAHGEWLARQIPGARAELLEEHGHLSLVGAYPEILDVLIASAG
jgi:pimeloyl-ACP methyl ester carboxylesterase